MISAKSEVAVDALAGKLRTEMAAKPVAPAAGAAVPPERDPFYSYEGATPLEGVALAVKCVL